MVDVPKWCSFVLSSAVQERVSSLGSSKVLSEAPTLCRQVPIMWISCGSHVENGSRLISTVSTPPQVCIFKELPPRDRHR